LIYQLDYYEKYNTYVDILTLRVDRCQNVCVIDQTGENPKKLTSSKHQEKKHPALRAEEGLIFSFQLSYLSTTYIFNDRLRHKSLLI